MLSTTGHKFEFRLVTRMRVIGICAVFLAAVVTAMVMAILWGPTEINLTQALWGTTSPNFDRIVLVQERIPRVVLAASVGASLSVVGTAFQALMQNPLADPFILGTSGGAALGATILLSMGLSSTVIAGVWIPLLPFGAFGGAVLSLLIVYGLSVGYGRLSAYRILLIGVVFNFFASAVIMFLKMAVQSTKAQEMLLWLMGSLSLDRITWTELGISWGITLFGTIFLFFCGRELNVVSLGDEGATNLGVDLERTRRRIFVVSSILVGAAVSITGLLGFIGLIVPHALRLVFGSDHRLLIPLSALAGAGFLVICDFLARWMFPWLLTEAPVGLITAFVGGPTFVWLLLRDKTLTRGSNA